MREIAIVLVLGGVVSAAYIALVRWDIGRIRAEPPAVPASAWTIEEHVDKIDGSRAYGLSRKSDPYTGAFGPAVGQIQLACTGGRYLVALVLPETVEHRKQNRGMTDLRVRIDSEIFAHEAELAQDRRTVLLGAVSNWPSRLAGASAAVFEVPLAQGRAAQLSFDLRGYREKLEDLRLRCGW